jgi:response regulator RpfG family c-di-GMP phosphodiesterase
VGRREEEIPLGARLLSLADAYVSLATESGTRPAAELSADHILCLLRQGAGSRYDPELVATLARPVDSVPLLALTRRWEASPGLSLWQ